MKIRSFLRNCSEDFKDVVSVAYLIVGAPPPWISSPRSALEQWKWASVSAQVSVSGGRPCIFATRNRTWIEWAFFAALYLKKMGENPIVLYSSSELKQIYRPVRLLELFGFNFPAGIAGLEGVALVDIDKIEVTDRSKDPALKSFAKDLAPTVAAYDCRVEEDEKHFFVEEYRSSIMRAERALEHHATVFHAALSSWHATRVISPSGLIGMTPAMLFASRRLNLHALFVEGWAWRKGHMIWNVDRPALDYDVEGWLALSKGWDEAREQDANDFRRFQEHEVVLRDDWFVGFRVIQRAPRSKSLDGALDGFLHRSGPMFLLGTNVVGDSATLGRGGCLLTRRSGFNTQFRFSVKGAI